MPPTFNAFLSHRYRSPAVNLFFFEMFCEAANVQFAVDEGKFETNVTHLERKIRDVDAFIGIYPFPDEQDPAPPRERLLEESAYFRLELDIATRARKPGIVYYDERYRDIVRCPPHVKMVAFAAPRASGNADTPERRLYRSRFDELCTAVRAHQEFAIAMREGDVRRRDVGVFLPRGEGGYSATDVDVVCTALAARGIESVRVAAWPPRLETELHELLPTLDFAIVDVGPAGAAVAAYLHGAAVPAIRLQRADAGDPPRTTPDLTRIFYEPIPVGYVKNVVRWHDAEALRDGLERRLESMLLRRERFIRGRDDAVEYFREAARRPERVFLSYSGREFDLAQAVGDTLRARFQQVFDYRDDGQSIPAGVRWMDQIFDTLSESPIGVPLLSGAYLASGNCLHELRAMAQLADEGRMVLIPVKLHAEENLALPSFMGDTQYFRWGATAERARSGRLLEAIDKAVERAKGTKAGGAAPASGS